MKDVGPCCLDRQVVKRGKEPHHHDEGINSWFTHHLHGTAARLQRCRLKQCIESSRVLLLEAAIDHDLGEIQEGLLMLVLGLRLGHAHLDGLNKANKDTIRHLDGLSYRCDPIARRIFPVLIFAWARAQ